MSTVDQRHAERYAAAQRAVAVARTQDRASRATIVVSGPDLRAGARKLSFGVALAALCAAIVGLVSMATGDRLAIALPAFSLPDISLPASPDSSPNPEPSSVSPSADKPPELPDIPFSEEASGEASLRGALREAQEQAGSHSRDRAETPPLPAEQGGKP